MQALFLKAVAVSRVRHAAVTRWVVALAVGVLFFALSAPAQAYPWMIRYGATDCAGCHTDPSGAGVLTAFGRGQGDLLWDSGREEHCSPEVETCTPSGASGFLWGAFRLPGSLRLGGNFRTVFESTTRDSRPVDRTLLLPRADVGGDLKVGRFRAAASIGYADRVSNASITRGDEHTVVSREHWIGYELGRDNAWLLRAGRIRLPFGIRNVEDALWVRNQTRTDIDDDQQHGVALYGKVGRFRGEVMGILGNFQIRPDDYRERGYSAYVEFAATDRLAFGLSSLYTRARRDIVFRVTDYRHAHGAFVRYAPAPSFVLMSEVDWIYQSLTWNGHRGGYAAVLQGDWEPTRGIHFMLTAETRNEGNVGEPASLGVWGSAVWFFAPHADLRIDDVYRRIGRAGGGEDLFSWFVRLHLYL